MRVALIEARDPKLSRQPDFDARTVALSFSSKQIFDALGVWSHIAALGTAAITEIHVSDRGHPGMAHLHAADQNVEALGYVAESRVLGEALAVRMAECKDIATWWPAKLSGLQLDEDAARLQLEYEGEQREMSASLVVAADGTDSFVRRELGVRTWAWDYRQDAIICNVAMDRPHGGHAFERFTAGGPMALLPLPPLPDADNACGVVWTCARSKGDGIMAMSDDDFIAELRDRFGDRAGQFLRVGQRQRYPLRFVQTREHVRSRLAFIGNAAHTLHPVAGQGFNLGLRDVAALAQVIQEARDAGSDPGRLDVLRNYARWRRRDHLQTAMFTDSLVRVFSSDFLPIVMARNLGLFAMELLPPLKQGLTRHAMGYIGKASRLARGLRR
jgi:2-octaprenyl-6-methoxyphenol hydroxylase